MTSAYEEKLRRMLDEGKISVEQYEKLQAALPTKGSLESAPRPPAATPESECGAFNRAWAAYFPPRVQVSFVAAIIIVGSIAELAIHLNLPGCSLWSPRIVLQLVFAIGILRLKVWAYLGALLVCGWSVALLLAWSIREEVVQPFCFALYFYFLLLVIPRTFFPGVQLMVKKGTHRFKRLRKGEDTP